MASSRLLIVKSSEDNEDPIIRGRLTDANNYFFFRLYNDLQPLRVRTTRVIPRHEYFAQASSLTRDIYDKFRICRLFNC